MDSRVVLDTQIDIQPSYVVHAWGLINKAELILCFKDNVYQILCDIFTGKIFHLCVV